MSIPVCPKCGSHFVLCDAYAEWDKDKWVLHSIYEAFVCNQCGLDIDPEWVDYESLSSNTTSQDTEITN